MGRRAINRIRKTDKEKTQPWIHTLYHYFQKNGLKGITMDLLAKEIGKSKTTVYDYFPTKEDLLDEVILYKLEEIKGFKKIIGNTEKTFKQRCYELLKFQTNHIADISNIFLSDLKALYPIHWQKVESFLDYLSEETAKFYDAGIQAEEFNPIRTSILVLNDRLFFRTLTDPNFLNAHQLTLQEAFEQYSQLRFFGIIRNQGD